jgi:TonB family protein
MCPLFSHGQSALTESPPPEPRDSVSEMQPADANKVFSAVEHVPEFQGGQKGLMIFLTENIKYPKDARENGIQGRVLVKFIVCTDGSLCDAEVVRSVSPSIDTEVLRVVKSMPNWKPGVQNGQPVRVFYTLPVSFKLAEDEKGGEIDILLKDKRPEFKVYSFVEKIPEYPGGTAAMNKFIASQIVYPKDVKDGRIEGKVVVRFIVDKDGSILYPEATRTIGGGCDEEAVRIVNAMPKWKPGMQKGEPVRVLCSLPVAFSL